MPTVSACYIGLVNLMTVSLVRIIHQPIASGFMYVMLGIAWLLAYIISGKK